MPHGVTVHVCVCVSACGVMMCVCSLSAHIFMQACRSDELHSRVLRVSGNL